MTMAKQNFDTQLTGQKAFTLVQSIILEAGHYLLPVDGSIDKALDGYIRLRKRVTLTKDTKAGRVKGIDYVETGNLVGIQIKGISRIPTTGSSSYYIRVKEDKKFGINFGTKDKLDKHKVIWKNFIGPVIVVFVDLETGKVWWGDTNDPKAFPKAGYSMLINEENRFNPGAFKKIKKLGREKFVSKVVPTIDTDNSDFRTLALGDFTESARMLYSNLQGNGDLAYPDIDNRTIGKIRYSQSGWKHITRLNRRKMRIFNSLLLLGVSHRICSEIEDYTRVKKGKIRESKRYIKKVEFLTLRANVNFNFRQSSVVQVVLRKVTTFDKISPSKSIPSELFFHSVYEPYRKE